MNFSTLGNVSFIDANFFFNLLSLRSVQRFISGIDTEMHCLDDSKVKQQDDKCYNGSTESGFVEDKEVLYICKSKFKFYQD